MGASEQIRAQQVERTQAKGLEVDSQGYVSTVEENLFRPLSDKTRAELEAGGGSELKGKDGKPAKMCALHSSAALVCNMFDYWRDDPAVVARALNIGAPVNDVKLEAKLPSGLGGHPPTLDLLLTGSDDRAWAVEAKFREPYTLGKKYPPFADSYFPAGEGLWERLGLPKCQELAEDLQAGGVSFGYLDAPQLLKHTLGLRVNYPQGELLLLWYQVDGEEREEFAREIAAFAGAVDESLAFRGITYQQVFQNMQVEHGGDPSHRAYFDYLRARYFAD